MNHIHSALLSLAGAMCFAASATAQESPAQLQETVAAAVTSEHLAAADDLYRSIVLHSGILDGMIDYARTSMIPELRAGVVGSPLYRNASPPRREALLRVIDSLPDFLRQEFETQLSAMSVRVAPRFAERMSMEHLSQTAAFMRSEEMRTPWLDLLDATIADKPSAGAFPEWEAVGTFVETEAGRVFAEEEDHFGDILAEEMEQMLTLLLPRMRALAAGQICDALEEDCPAYVRDEAGRI